MKIGVFGTGMVGEAIATRLVALGHEVRMGSRTANNDKGAAWVARNGARASQGTFADTAAFGELLFNCTSGHASLDALRAAGADNIGDKVLVDVSNPLDFSKGAPRLFVGNDDSLAEQIQRAFPRARVVKTLNTLNCELMVDPRRLAGGKHDVFVCGNDSAAREQVAGVLAAFGWENIVDLGDLTAARATEAWVMLWLRLYGRFGTAEFNLHLAR